ncbi:MAG: hypothetical protein MJ252_24440 [archaeon]|nr:hypothetical protein [archaeon]
MSTPETMQHMPQSSILNDEQVPCYFCDNYTISKYKYSCTHIMCPICLYRKIFCYKIKSFQNTDPITLNCKCGEGNITVTCDEVIELISTKKSLDNEERNNPNRKKKILSFCKSHSNQYTNYYCVDCYSYVCKKCAFFSQSIHAKHRVVPASRIIQTILKNIPEIPMKLKTGELYKNNFKMMTDKLKEVTQTNYNYTMSCFDDLIKTIKMLKKEYEEEQKKVLDQTSKSLRILNDFYNEYYKDMQYATTSDDVNLLRYLNNIGDELMEIQVINNTEIDNKITVIKKEIDLLRQESKNSMNLSFFFSEVSRNFKCEDIIFKAHKQFIPTMIQTKDERIMTGSNDYTIKIWEENEEKFTEVYSITKMTGKVLALLQIHDGRILSSCQESGVVKLWISDSKGFSLQHTLTSHNAAVTSMIELKNNDNCIVTASVDNSLIIWQEINEIFQAVKTLNADNNIFNILLNLYDGRFASVTSNGKLKLWTNKQNFDFTDKLSAEGNNKKIRTLCQLTNGQIMSGGEGSSLLRWAEIDGVYQVVQKLNAHQSDVSCIIELGDGRLASSSKDRTIKIWKIRENSWFELAESLCQYEHGMYSLIKLKDGRICSVSSDCSLVFWRDRVDSY